MKINITLTGSSKQDLSRRWRGFRTRVLLCGLLAWAAALPSWAQLAPIAAACRSDRILVKPRVGIPPAALANLHVALGNRVLRSFPRMGNWEVIRIPAAAGVANMLRAYKLSGLVAQAEPDYIMHVAMLPDDFYFLQGNQWNLINVGQNGGTPGCDIDATNAWDLRTSASNIIVAVVDTGIRYTHEDLAPNMWQNPQENADGYTNDLYGINLTANGRGEGDPWDDFGHGTHVAGIIGAVGNNRVGIAGVCWNVRLMALKFIDTNGDGTVSDAITCLDFAANHGAKVINASWGGFNFTSAALWDAANALRDQNIIFVAAAGNSANDNDINQFYPANYSASLDNVITVAASDPNDQVASWSDYGPNTVQLAAPGDPVFSCWNGSDSDYQYYQGTSMAAPHVAGACALVWAENTNLTALQVINQVVKGADVLTNLSGMVRSSGRLNLYQALVLPTDSQSPPPGTNIWVDDSLPAGAEANTDFVTNYDGDGNVEWVDEPWLWVANDPAPFSGTAAHQSPDLAGIHEHYFVNATNTLVVYRGDTLFVWVYLDPTNPPDEIMLAWNDGCWEHRAFWGADNIPWGEDGTSGRLDMGDLPPAGQWVRLAVPASALKLEGATLQGMGFMLDNGAATWDAAGRSSSP